MPSTTVYRSWCIQLLTFFFVFFCQGSGRQLKPAEGRMLTVLLAAGCCLSDEWQLRAAVRAAAGESWGLQDIDFPNLLMNCDKRFNESVQNGWLVSFLKIIWHNSGSFWISIIDLKLLTACYAIPVFLKFTHETCGKLWQRFLQIWAVGLEILTWLVGRWSNATTELNMPCR